LTVDWILDQLGDAPREARRHHRRFVLGGIKEPSPWLKLKAQCRLGGRAFIEKIAPALKDKSQLTKIPKAQRLLQRPALEHILPGEETSRSTGERNKAITAAQLYTVCSEGTISWQL
jgi:hypothetical protein